MEPRLVVRGPAPEAGSRRVPLRTRGWPEMHLAADERLGRGFQLRGPEEIFSTQLYSPSRPDARRSQTSSAHWRDQDSVRVCDARRRHRSLAAHSRSRSSQFRSAQFLRSRPITSMDSEVSDPTASENSCKVISSCSSAATIAPTRVASSNFARLSILLF